MSLSKFKKKTTKAAADHPVYPDGDGACGPAVDQIVSLRDKRDTLDAQLKDAEALLKERVSNWFFTNYNGKSDIPSSVKAEGSTDAVLVSFVNRYSAIDVDAKSADKLDKIHRILGSKFDESFHEDCDFVIKGSNVAEENREQFIEALSLIADVFCHCPLPADFQQEFVDTLKVTVQCGYDQSNGQACEAITVKETVKAQSTFHINRHTALSADDNIKLHRVLPCTVSVKTKGVT